MRQYVREMLARHLGVPVHSIRLWRLTAGQGSMASSNSARAPGMLEAELEDLVSELDRAVFIAGSPELLARIANSKPVSP